MINHDSEQQGMCIISEDIQNGSNYSATLKEYRRIKKRSNECEQIEKYDWKNRIQWIGYMI